MLDERLPERIVIVSFRFRPNPDDIHGGQDVFVHGLLRALVARGAAVEVVTFRGRDDAPEAIVEGARVHLLETPHSSGVSAHEAHRRGTWPLLEVMAAYSSAVERFLPQLRARQGGRPLVIFSHDIAEAGWVRSARLAGDHVITFAHVLFTEFALHDLTLEEFERMNDCARFPIHVRALGRLILSKRSGRRYLDWGARAMQRTAFFSMLPGASRAALEGEHAAFMDAERVLFPSVTMRQKVIERYAREDADRALQVAPWGIDLAPVSRSEVEALAAKLGVASEDRVLVTMSRISPDKRIDALIAALARVDAGDAAFAKKVVAVICGRPTFLDDHAYEARLVEQAKRLRHVRVVFAGYQRGPSRTAHLELASRRFGRFVQVGRYEAFGLGIAEALSRGIPAITSDTDGARVILDPERSEAVEEAASIVTPRAGEPFDVALSRAIEDELSGRSQRSSRVAERIAERFTWDATLAAVSKAVGAIAPELRRRQTRAASRVG
jgi:glycosyltransferase involved in cell wall biosynthesis